MPPVFEPGTPAPVPFRTAALLPRGSLSSLAKRRASAAEAGLPDTPEGRFLLRFRADQSLRHLAETIGLPGTEIGGAIVDGEAWSLELPPPDGAFAELLPVEEPLPTLGRPSFVLDVHLGRLARDLRLLGFDTAWSGDLDDEGIAGCAVAEGRIALSRDRGLLYRRAFYPHGREGAAARGMLIRSKDPYEQLLEVSRRFGLGPMARPLSLCASCGSALRPATPEEVAPLIPPIVAQRYSEFLLCPGCGKPYWKGDHLRTIIPLLERITLR